MHHRGLCFKRSKVVNIPMNLVQTIWTGSINMGTLSQSYLLDLFNKGKRIDFEALFQINNPSAHINYEPSFTDRNQMELCHYLFSYFAFIQMIQQNKFI
jgi:hypothetical protein